MRHLIRLGLILGVAGCSVGPGFGENQNGIIGGTDDSGDPSVVMVYAQNSSGASICTGEVISPHVVLTAAHCVDPATVGSGNTFYIFTGWNVNDSTQANNNALWHTVRLTDYDHTFDPNNLQGGHDVGIVVLDSPLPLSPLPLNTQTLSAGDIGETLRLVGYGIDNGNDTQGTSAGTKRQVNTTLQQYNSILLAFGDASHNTCEGDSGGPAFATVNGQEVILGTTSFGDQGCMQGGVDTRVDAYLSFIEGYVQQYDPNGATYDFTTRPVDFARGGSADFARGFGADMGIAPGTVGAACTSDSECNSHICALTGATGFCTQPCDPKQTNSCPAGTYCGVIDTSNYCIKSVGRSGGSSCDVGEGPAAPIAPVGGAVALVLLAGFGLVLRRRVAVRVVDRRRR